MMNISKTSKVFLYITVLSGTLWLGCYVLRMLLFYQLFEGPDLILKPYINSQNIAGIYEALLPAFSSTLILYLVFIACFILFLVTSKLSLKNEGWLFITVVIVFITLPFEAWLMTLDYEIVQNILSGSINTSLITSNIKDRLTVLSSFPLIEIFSYFAVIFLLIFQPLKKVPAANEN